MYLGYQNGKIKFYTEQPLGPIYNVDKVEETDEEYMLFEGDYVLLSEYEELQQQKQKQEILSLYMTRSDFFDGTIKAFGLNQHDLYPIIESVLEGILSEKETKIALNNFENALNFYRKHPLFTLLSNIDIPEIGIITPQQWDNFFIQVNEGNSDAYKQLLGE